MTSTLLFLVIFVVTGTLLTETSATVLINIISAGILQAQKAVERKPVITRNLWNEAIKAFDDGIYQVTFNLAPSYGTLNSKALQQLDESLRVMMAGILEIDIQDEYSWNHLMAMLDMSFYLKKQTRYSIKKIERISFKAIRLLGNGADKTKRGKLIHTWFRTLIGSEDILKDADIDLDTLVNMVSEVSVHMLKNLMTHKTKKMSLWDVGILRFPDISQPYFSVYRINLIGTCHYKTYVFQQEESSDILGLFQREVYYPDKKYINSLNRNLIEQLLLEVDELFSD